MKFRWLILAALLIGCGAASQIPPAPSPISTPTPLPSQAPFEPLKAQGSRWSREVLGLSSCCGLHGWPWIDNTLLYSWAGAGGNLVHIRLGPYWNVQEGSQYNLYEAIGRRADLARFRYSSWLLLDSLARTALALQVYLEVDLIDGWVMKPANITLSPWHAQNNVQNDMHVGCGELQSQMDATQEAFVRHAVDILGPYQNVIWQVGNENGVCSPPVTSAWETDLIWVVRDEEFKQHQIAHMIGTNSEIPKIEALPAVGYVMVHQSEAVTVHAGKPTGVNEYPNITPGEYEAQLDRALDYGTRFDLWLGDSTDADLAQYLVIAKNHKGTNH